MALRQGVEALPDTTGTISLNGGHTLAQDVDLDDHAQPLIKAGGVLDAQASRSRCQRRSGITVAPEGS